MTDKSLRGRGHEGEKINVSSQRLCLKHNFGNTYILQALTCMTSSALLLTTNKNFVEKIEEILQNPTEGEESLKSGTQS